MLKDVKGNHCNYDEELIKELKLEKYSTNQSEHFSSGTKQRVAVR